MTLRYQHVSFLSDYGRTDEFVGVVHSVLHQMCPGVNVIDVTHDVPAFDVRAGGLTLARSAQYLAPGVVMAVVDPGVGSRRRAIAVEVAGGAAVLVGPDNGLLAPAVAMIGGAERAVWLNDPQYHLDSPGTTFDGRDVFAPVAAHLCQGVALEELGEVIDPAGLMPGLMPVARTEDDGTVAAEVLWVDQYGNVQLNLGPDDLDPLGSHVELAISGARHSARRAANFTEIGAGALGLITDSYGMLAVAADRASAAEELRVAAGDEVVVRVIDSPDEPPGGGAVEVPIRLGRTEA
jgi:S-adenosylmethionine hydrolase